MTESTGTHAEGAQQPRRSRWARYSLLAAQGLIVLMLFDGFIDLSYPIARKAWHAVKPSSVVQSDRAAGWSDYRTRYVAGLGTIAEPVSGPGLHVDGLGVRATGNPGRSGARGVMLGSSQAFGHYVADDATLAAAIERRRKDVTVTLIAGPARTVAESMMNWQHVAARVDAPDFALFLFSNIELYQSCQPQIPPQEPSEHKPAIVSIPVRRLNNSWPAPVEFPCVKPEARAAVVERALYELRGAIAFGRARNPHFVVVIAPLMYGNRSNASRFRAELDPTFVKSIDLAITEFRTRLAAENLPGVIDMSAAFDGKGNAYFSDSASHFSRAGAEHLAGELLKRLPDDFFGADGLGAGKRLAEPKDPQVRIPARRQPAKS